MYARLGMAAYAYNPSTWEAKVEELWWGQGGEMTQALYAHMNNKIK
jgi:hypothetical protein